MAVAARGRAELLKQWREKETSPERTKVWTEPKMRTGATGERKVPVVYYVSRNGHLEHPHFMEVPLSSAADGLYLRDVINRFNLLRGKGMASMYSWSSKRSYKNGFVWHDLSEDDFIYPAHGHEYVLKGSEIHLNLVGAPPQETTLSSSSSTGNSEGNFAPSRRKKTPWSSFDLNEYKVYKGDLTADSAAAKVAADASTQTDDRRNSRRYPVEENHTTELGREEISPPPSSSSPETLESLIKADGRINAGVANVEHDRTAENYPSGRMRASAVLMHLISCGSISVKDHGFSLAPQYRARLPRPRAPPSDQMEIKRDRPMGKQGVGGNDSGLLTVRLEDKEYFSGSLIETKKKSSYGAVDFPALKRSSSYNADRASGLGLAEKEIDGVRAKCIPRRPGLPAKIDGGGNAVISRSTHGSKRINDEPTALKSETNITSSQNP